MMVAEPMPVPVTVGCVTGVVAPAAIDTVAGDTVTLEASLLAKLIVTAVTAGPDKLTAKGVVCPSAMEALATLIVN